MRVARLYRLSGRVQGVGFRFFAQDAASLEDLTGWVKNLPDGRLEVSAEGEAEAMDRFERALHRGPIGARVERVETEVQAPTGRTFGFTIKN